MEKNQRNSNAGGKSNTGRGGARKGAGRKPGSATKRTREIADKAAATGVTPLEVMLDNMLFAHTRAGEVLAKILASDAKAAETLDSFKELLRFRAMAQESAKDAAPYVHPRLAAVEHSGGLTVRSLAEELAELNGTVGNAKGRSPVA